MARRQVLLRGRADHLLDHDVLLRCDTAFATVGSAVFVTKTPPLPCGLLVVFPPITLAGLLYFNAKHFVDKYNL